MKRLALLAFIFASNVQANDVVTGEVIRVHDGDTLTLKAGTEQLNIRLARIDAPELKQPFGKESGNYLREIVKGKTVTVDIETIDRYGRAVGTVMMGNENINALMVQDGYAWVYDQYAKDVEGAALNELENVAREKQKGLWIDENPIYPPDFRKSQK